MRVTACIVLLTICIDVLGQIKDRPEQLFMFWNVENFFDWTDQGTGESDAEFSSMGNRRWTRNKFYAKCDAVAKTVFWLADRYGRMPDVIGLAEVENRGVLTRMLSSTLLRKYDYGIVHRQSADRRGIDVAMLYRKSVLDTLSTSFVTPLYKGKSMPTRCILHARMRLANGFMADFIVNHHPSKFGGEEESKDRRNAAMETLKRLCDSLKGNHMLVMGDFNDTPDAEQFRMIDGILVNKAEGLYKKREGTIRYEGKWELIDMFMTSPSLSDESRMEIVRVPFLMTYEKKHPGERPLRTYVGPRYVGGVSDHCPIVLRIHFQ